jgi:hypothetical protein
VTIAPLKIGYTPAEFQHYCETELPKRMKAWRPRGCVLHNTFNPNLKQVEHYIASGKWRFDQLIENWWTRYRQLGWYSGPHLFVMPDRIWVATPLWIRGTHSPSYNATFWGVELVGDYDTEQLPEPLRSNAVHAMACLYAMLGHEPTPENFKFHGEDPRTLHKNCPGRAVHPKVWWDVAIEKRMAELHPGEDHEAIVA